MEYAVCILVGALIGALAVGIPLYTRLKASRNYRRLQRELEWMDEHAHATYDTEKRADEFLRIIRHSRDTYGALNGYDTRQARKYLPWLFYNRLSWELTELIQFLNHIGLDICLIGRKNGRICTGTWPKEHKMPVYLNYDEDGNVIPFSKFKTTSRGPVSKKRVNVNERYRS